jgi:hypothetical protein
VQVVHRDERQPAGPGERLGRGEPDEQRTDEPGPARDRDALDVVQARTPFCQRLPDHRRDELEMSARSHLRHDAAKARVQLGLRRHHIRPYVAVLRDQRRRSFVAAGFDSQDHCFVAAGLYPQDHCFASATKLFHFVDADSGRLSRRWLSLVGSWWTFTSVQAECRACWPRSASTWSRECCPLATT